MSTGSLSSPLVAALVLGSLLGATSAHESRSPQVPPQEPQAASSTLAAASYLLAAQQDRKLDARDPEDAQLLGLLALRGPDMRPLRDFRDPPSVGVGVARRAWRLAHEHAVAVAGARVRLVWPAAEELLRAAEVSGQCASAARATSEAAARLESWAVQMLNSWGSFPPSGIFEGTFGDIGAYHQCLDVPENAATGHAHYCSLAFRPVVPTRAEYELIVRREPAALRDTFRGNRSGPADAFTDLLEGAQYSHYIYYKLGACFPIGCSPRDVHKIARLLGRRNVLLSGPVKCYSKRAHDYQAPEDALQVSTRDLNEGVYVWRPHVTGAQWVALALVGLLSSALLAATLLDLVKNRAPQLLAALAPAPAAAPAPKSVEEPEPDPNNNAPPADHFPLDAFKSVPLDEPPAERKRKSEPASEPLWAELVRDCSAITNAREFFTVSESQRSNEILCINGVRCITMSWIIVTHTMQYNDWSAFARTREIETHLNSLLNQPLFNASYLVDSFFLVSGLLAAYTSLKGSGAGFSARNYLLGRWLRLTPQILLTSALFVLLPLASRSASPHWYTITGEYAENCADNWWVNLLHLQAFYRPERMCNFVCWWVSVDMLFHVLALALILVLLRLGGRRALALGALLVLAAVAVQSARHYQLALPPNLLSTVPQTGAMWAEMTLGFFWTPYAHALPFFAGFALGYLLARREDLLRALLAGRRAPLGWALALALLLAQSYSTYGWVVGAYGWTRWGATLFYALCPLVWAGCLGWLVLACQLGRGGPVNALLSARLFLVLGKASYVVYLSHFLVLFGFFGAQNLLLEPSQLMMLYVMIGNIALSMLLGCALCVCFEMPWLKLQRRIMRRLR